MKDVKIHFHRHSAMESRHNLPPDHVVIDLSSYLAVERMIVGFNEQRKEMADLKEVIRKLRLLGDNNE